MKRVAATIDLDLRLQWRSGFYHAALVVTVAAWLFLRLLPPIAQERLLPVLLINNLLVTTFYFSAGLLLLEKGEGTLTAQVITPLRPREHLLSRAVTLALLGTLESGLLVALVQGPAALPRLLPLVAGLFLGGALLALAGFICVVRYHGVSDFLLPSLLYALVLALPLLPYFGLGAGPWIYLHPLQAVLSLLQGDSIVYGLVYALLWLGLVGWIAQHAYRRHLVESHAGAGR